MCLPAASRKPMRHLTGLAAASPVQSHGPWRPSLPHPNPSPSSIGAACRFQHAAGEAVGVRPRRGPAPPGADRRRSLAACGPLQPPPAGRPAVCQGVPGRVRARRAYPAARVRPFS